MLVLKNASKKNKSGMYSAHTHTARSFKDDHYSKLNRGYFSLAVSPRCKATAVSLMAKQVLKGSFSKMQCIYFLQYLYGSFNF